MDVDFVYLASASPRRRQLLAQIGVRFQVLNVNVDESIQGGERAEGYVLRLAEAKAGAGLARRLAAGGPQRPVLGADTAVVAGGAILGKPADRKDAERMLGLLSASTHEVLTAVALATDDGVRSRLCRSEVTFREITSEEARDYCSTREGLDKAGAYAIQGYGAVFVSGLHGSYSGVMGLPLFETAQVLRAAGVRCWLDTEGTAATDGH